MPIVLMLALVLHQAPAALPIYVAHYGTDRTGARFAYNIREAIRDSRGYTLAVDQDHALLVLHVMTVEDTDDQDVTAASLALVVNNDCHAFLWGGVRVLGFKRTADSAIELVALIDREVNAWRQQEPK